MNRTWFVVENIETAPRIRLFRLFGVDWLATTAAWLMPVIYISLGVVIALLVLPERDLSERLLSGLGYGVIIVFVYLVHSVGHSLSARLAGAPMRENLITVLRSVNLYYDADESQLPSRVHLMRAIGGPVINVLLGLLGLVGWALFDHHLWQFFAISNLVLGLGALLPVPSLDGDVILREWRR